MRRSTIAVCSLMLLSSSPALACYDEHKAGWFNEMPARSWELPEVGGGENQWEEMSRLWVLAVGTAALALIAVSFRAYSRARGKDLMPAVEPAAPPLALPFAWPSDLTIRVDRGHEPGEPTRALAESVGTFSVVAAGAD